MTIDKESWGYRRNAHAEDYYNMDELTEILAQTIRYAVLKHSDYICVLLVVHPKAVLAGSCQKLE